jgi:hypothetical protein
MHARRWLQKSPRMIDLELRPHACTGACRRHMAPMLGSLWASAVPSLSICGWLFFREARLREGAAGHPRRSAEPTLDIVQSEVQATKRIQTEHRMEVSNGDPQRLIETPMPRTTATSNPIDRHHRHDSVRAAPRARDRGSPQSLSSGRRRAARVSGAADRRDQAGRRHFADRDQVWLQFVQKGIPTVG